jgi:hypothetical protein
MAKPQKGVADAAAKLIAKYGRAVVTQAIKNSSKPVSKYPTSNVKVIKKTKTTKPKKMSQKEFNKREWAEYKYQN